MRRCMIFAAATWILSVPGRERDPFAAERPAKGGTMLCLDQAIAFRANLETRNVEKSKREELGSGECGQLQSAKCSNVEKRNVGNMESCIINLKKIP